MVSQVKLELLLDYINIGYLMILFPTRSHNLFIN